MNVSKEQVDNEIALLVRTSGVDGRILAALRRGIGIHHAGMNKGYRALVERYPNYFGRNFWLTTPSVGSVRGIYAW